MGLCRREVQLTPPRLLNATDVRRIATELRPSVLDHLGLLAAVEWQAQEFEKRTGLPVRQELSSRGYRHLTRLELEVEENYGQSATYRESLVPD